MKTKYIFENEGKIFKS